MVTLIVTLLFGFVIAYFATQNTADISLNFLNYSLPGIPAYVVVGGALLIGVFLSWIISLVGRINTGLTMRGKDSKIKDYKKENEELTKQIQELELENTKLKTETNASS